MTKAIGSGFARVDVSINGADYSESKTVFEFIDVPKMTALVPYSGPTTGGTTQFISGSGFTQPDMQCNYGADGTVASADGSTGELRCVSPAAGPRPLPF